MRRHYRISAAPLVLVTLLAGLTGCSSLNPFSSGDKIKVAELKPIQASVDVKTLWSESVPKAEGYVFTPAVAGQKVFAAGRNGVVAAFEDGKRLWKTDVDQKLSAGVGSDGKLVVVATSKGDVIALSADDGKVLWRAKAGSEVLAPPAVTSDLVVVKGSDYRLFAFDPADGRKKWTYQRQTPPLALRSTAPVLVVDRYVFSGFPGGKLVAVASNNGAALWEGTVALPKGTTELDRIADVVAGPVLEGNQICAVAYQGRIACFDLQTGNSLWARDFSSTAGLAIDNRQVYAVDDKGTIQAFDRFSGSSVWKQDKLSNRQLTTPLVRRGVVVTADLEGRVHVLNRDTGAFIGRSATDGSPVTAPLVPQGAGFVVETQKGGVFALDLQ
ncbi:outer membrane protein assembly factor BamB [Oryzomicrobium sp.]|uniref:outer membrane protein assembly factor BamB n=1 Tax=Oryzomicrobium sp. TaxID=1911578 RepID=UPI002FE3BF0A